MIPMRFWRVCGLVFLYEDVAYHYGELFEFVRGGGFHACFWRDWAVFLVCISAPFGMNRSRMGAFSVSFSVLGVFSGSDA